VWDGIKSRDDAFTKEKKGAGSEFGVQGEVNRQVVNKASKQ